MTSQRSGSLDWRETASGTERSSPRLPERCGGVNIVMAGCIPATVGGTPASAMYRAASRYCLSRAPPSDNTARASCDGPRRGLSMLAAPAASRGVADALGIFGLSRPNSFFIGPGGKEKL